MSALDIAFALAVVTLPYVVLRVRRAWLLRRYERAIDAEIEAYDDAAFAKERDEAITVARNLRDLILHTRSAPITRWTP